MGDLKEIYAAADEPVALQALDAFDSKWSSKYPKTAKSWKDNWATLSTYFKYPQEVRTLIYTTNIIEGFNRQPMIDITKKWTGRRKDWGIIHSQLDIYFPGRMS